ncbi:DNA transfer protein p32 [Burkholderia sp. Bp8984]|uniref:DNA transfer protein p32 n=1 Tax=Burkholderia sp. Bp8984 TaxID=2184549 RepID=UPI000F5A79B3|nr:DNA transfer protein p32 [Burkholderia sp. Bp8984]
MGAQSAADTQAGAQQQAAQTQLDMFNTINGQEQPFMKAGYGATTVLNQLLGLTPNNPADGLPNGYLTQTFNPSSIASSPGYQFAQQQGLQAVQNADAPSVGALSGPALKDMLNFSTGTAEQYYNNYFNQFQTQQQNIFSRLANLANLGQNAASNTGQAGTQLGTGAAQAIASSGASQAAGTIGSANAISGGLNSLGSTLMLSKILGGGGLGGGMGGDAGIPGWTPAGS